MWPSLSFPGSCMYVQVHSQYFGNFMQKTCVVRCSLCVKCWIVCCKHTSHLSRSVFYTHHSIPQYITVYHSISQYTTVYHSTSQYFAVYHRIPQYITVYCSISQCHYEYIYAYWLASRQHMQEDKQPWSRRLWPSCDSFREGMDGKYV